MPDPLYDMINDLPAEAASDLDDALFAETRPAVTRKVTGQALADYVNGQLAEKPLATTGVGSVLGLDGGGEVVRLPVALTPNVSSTGRFGLKNAGGLFIHEDYAARPTIATVGMSSRMQSSLTYSGGTPGQVVSNEWNSVTVADGVDDFVWAGLDIMANHATNGENVARYAQAKKFGSGPTWAAVLEMRDYDDTSHAAVAVEIDVFGNGANNKANRIGIDLVVGKVDADGAVCGVGCGIRIGPQYGDQSLATIDNGIQLKGKMVTGYQVATSGTWGILFSNSASLAVGIDLSNGSYSAAPIRIAADTKMQLDASGAIKFGYETVGTKIVFQNTSIERFSVNTTSGAVSVNGTQVIGPRATGYAPMTGTANASASYDSSTVTLAQLAGRVMALQIAMTNHGLIGA